MYDSTSSIRRTPSVVFDLNTDSGMKEFKKAVTDCDEDGNSPYDRIEITWPVPMLEVDIFI